VLEQADIKKVRVALGGQAKAELKRIEQRR